MPSQDQLKYELQQILMLYKLLVGREGTDDVETAIELGSIPSTIETDTIERNPMAGEAAKLKHGYSCQACDMDYLRIYGEIGKNFIEAHHLIPLNTLQESETASMDPERDFAVLCANCHRMVHMRTPCITVEELRKFPGVIAI